MTTQPTFDENYQSVAQRIKLFREKYPEGSLVAHDPTMPFSIVTVNELAYVVVAAVAKRTPEDTAPGLGLAWCPIPGTDEYTRNSEIMNAQTSAWGRAIIAVLAADATKIASSEEVRSAASHRTAPISAVTTTTIPSAGAATANSTSVRPEVAPMSTDPAQEEYNAAVITESVRLLNDPTTSYEALRDVWEVLKQAGLGARRVAAPAGMEPDGDNQVPIHAAVAFVGRQRKDAAEAQAAAPVEVAEAQPPVVEQQEPMPELTLVEDETASKPRRARKAAAGNE